jgi:hypothetical protein
MRVTVFDSHHASSHGGWLVVGLVAAALIVWRLCRIFRRKDSK